MSESDGSYELEMVKKYSHLRSESDQEISTWIPIIGFLLAVIGGIMMTLTFLILPFGMLGGPPGPGVFFLFFTGMAIFIVGALIGAILLLYLVYLWLDRLNKHFNRVRNMYRHMVLYLEKKGENDLARWLDSELRELEFKMSGERSPILWAILVFILGILIWYVLHMVNDSLRKLASSEYRIMDRLNHELRARGHGGLGIDYMSIGRVEKRDTVVYIILSIITFGLFTIYWAYVATKDVNEHFNAHHKVEDYLIRALETL